MENYIICQKKVIFHPKECANDGHKYDNERFRNYIYKTDTVDLIDNKCENINVTLSTNKPSYEINKSHTIEFNCFPCEYKIIYISLTYGNDTKIYNQIDSLASYNFQYADEEEDSSQDINTFIYDIIIVVEKLMKNYSYDFHGLSSNSLSVNHPIVIYADDNSHAVVAPMDSLSNIPELQEKIDKHNQIHLNVSPNILEYLFRNIYSGYTHEHLEIEDLKEVSQVEVMKAAENIKHGNLVFACATYFQKKYEGRYDEFLKKYNIIDGMFYNRVKMLQTINK